MNVAIIGASGYTGLELIKILINHPKFNISYIANSTGDINVQDLHPCLKDVINIDAVSYTHLTLPTKRIV